ncbi:hypothetical protein VKT23_019545 [Stygiomarasmius scandens]|uniref:Uncharacterized protein n=1 Tax=Marasmiellus scandens TaxID=2682957 RepID=A0ABR1IMR9_9AGAR
MPSITRLPLSMSSSPSLNERESERCSRSGKGRSSLSRQCLFVAFAHNRGGQGTCEEGEDEVDQGSDARDGEEEPDDVGDGDGLRLEASLLYYFDQVFGHFERYAIPLSECLFRRPRYAL